MKTLAIYAFSIVALAVAVGVARAQTLEPVAGDVYRWYDEGYFSLVVPTDEGVVVVDPINSRSVGALKRVLKEAGTQPVSHLIYSHAHSDHASGGVYLRAATIIAHANAPKTIDGVAPTVRFDDVETFSLGGKTFELVWLGEGHSDDLIAVIVRPENVAFVVDIASPKRLPWRDFPGDDIDGVIGQIEKLLTLDFEILAPGHGPVGVKADAGRTLAYIGALRAEVLKGLKAGKDLGELRASITMDDYSDWSNFSHLGLNIKGMARFLREAGHVD